MVPSPRPSTPLDFVFSREQMPMSSAERLKQVIKELSDIFVVLRQKVDEANDLLTDGILAISNSSDRPSGSATAFQFQELQTRIENLIEENREVSERYEILFAKYKRREAESQNAVFAREGAMRKYRHLVHVARDMLQEWSQRFPDEDVDEETRRAVIHDISGSPTTSSNDTARPRIVSRTHSPSHVGVEQTGIPGSDYTPRTGTQLSPLSRISAIEQEELPGILHIHSGSKCPGSVKIAMDPIRDEEITQLGFDANTVDGILESLTLPPEVSMRIALLPLVAAGDAEVAFLYDPLYLETGIKTYIIDWGTPTSNRRIIERLVGGNSDAVFHTFTFPTKKKRWYYLGGLSWKVVAMSEVWPTMRDESRSKILMQLSARSHGEILPEEIANQIHDGRLEQICIEIASINDGEVVQEIARRMKRSPRMVSTKRPRMRGEQ